MRKIKQCFHHYLWLGQGSPHSLICQTSVLMGLQLALVILGIAYDFLESWPALLAIVAIQLPLSTRIGMLLFPNTDYLQIIKSRQESNRNK